MEDDDWTWDPAKAARNKAKHSVSFALAVRVFDDPLHLTTEDPEPSEARYRTLGAVGTTVLFVVHTWPLNDRPGRIISARKATPRERRIYHDHA
ncbi:BrnT family toxin [uncultured Rhodospira sp.]|uniref:BrnT family toxin n=1 Tax=uncultured Rhodospira sp. TaxID=1936189 RepID=UPI00260EC330|nr:BrnT family toxin [uncultured Rhodospira sp.]